jgi:hypothetical protein
VPTRQHKSDVPPSPGYGGAGRGQTAEVALLGQEKIETRICSVSTMHRKRLTMQPRSKKSGVEARRIGGPAYAKASAWQAEVRHRRSERNARPMSNTLLLINYTL